MLTELRAANPKAIPETTETRSRNIPRRRLPSVPGTVRAQREKRFLDAFRGLCLQCFTLLFLLLVLCGSPCGKLTNSAIKLGEDLSES